MSVELSNANTEALGQLAVERYEYHLGLGETHEEALKSVAIVIALACNQGKITKELRAPVLNR